MNNPLVPALRDIEILFRPFRHRKLQLNGRIVLAAKPLSMAHKGVPSVQMEQFYQQRASHDLALIITEPLAIDDAAAAATNDDAVFYGGRALRVWKSICRTIHANGCKIAPLLYHAGMTRRVSHGANPSTPPIGPSGISPLTLQQCGESMTKQRIDEVKASYGRAAAHAKLLGFDAVEIQGAQHSLIEQFLRPETNLRLDEYGGNISARARFACEVIHAVRKAVGRNFPIILRLAQWPQKDGNPPLVSSAEEAAQLLAPLSEAGVDIFHCDSKHYTYPAFAGSPLTFASWVRLLTKKPTICSGGISSTLHRSTTDTAFMHLLHLLQANAFDLIAPQSAFDDTPALLRILRHP